MAKLSARGRQEVARVERVGKGDAELMVWTRHTRALMDDGIVLNRMDVQWKGQRGLEYGRWRVSGEVKPGLKPDDWLKAQRKSGYHPAQKRHSWAAVTVSTLSDAQVKEQLRRLR